MAGEQQATNQSVERAAAVLAAFSDTRALRVADVAIPVKTARSGYWAQTPAPLLCITLIAYHRNAPRCRPTWSARPIDWRREPMTCLV